MVSSPSFDPDKPPDSFEDDAYDGVFLNRVLSATYTPGSTFKLLTAAAMLEKEPDAKGKAFSCTGTLETDALILRAADGSRVRVTVQSGQLVLEAVQ